MHCTSHALYVHVACTAHALYVHIACTAHALYGHRTNPPNYVPGSHFHLKVDAAGRFERLFVGLAFAVTIAAATGIEFSGVDGTFFRHVYFHNGCLLLLVTRDGNNKLMVLCWVVCLKENTDNYLYMAEHAKKVKGLAEYLNRARHLLYSDRHKGIPGFEGQFKCGVANCIVHIVENVRDHIKKIKGAPVQHSITMPYPC